MTRRLFLEFFCGAGMARLGLNPARWRCMFANDNDLLKARAYIANFGPDGFNGSDVATLTLDDLPRERADLVWLSPPCQDHSLAGRRAGAAQGTRGAAVWGFLVLLQKLADAGRRPRVVVIENVVALMTSRGGSDFMAILDALKSAGYRRHRVFTIDARHFVPQSRERLFVVATDGAAIPDLPPPPVRNARLELIDWDAPPDPFEPATRRLLALMNRTHRAKLERAKLAGRRVVLPGCRRIRNGRQRFEVRDDGLANCLRCAKGGSSIQDLLLVDGAMVRSRKITPREAARLMGVGDS